MSAPELKRVNGRNRGQTNCACQCDHQRCIIALCPSVLPGLRERVGTGLAGTSKSVGLPSYDALSNKQRVLSDPPQRSNLLIDLDAGKHLRARKGKDNLIILVAENC